ncbi:MAG: phosphonatase-like hydrolase [Saprospiraceae bacterium]|nr:phosphonatase-like hydrolase [Saprospiraceae bacterium]
MIRLVVFDMAGTTVDEQNVVYKTVHQALLRAGFDVTLETVLLYAAGKEKFQAICDVMAHLQGGLVDTLRARAIHHDFEALLEEAYAALTPLQMPDAEEVFAVLRGRGVRVVLNTGYKRPVAEGLLQHLGWQQGSTYDLLLTADDVQQSRPHPDMIFEAMEHFGIEDGIEVAKIGDSIVDIEEGKNAGCGLVAGITTGAQTEEQLRTAQPTHIFHRLGDLIPAL